MEATDEVTAMTDPTDFGYGGYRFNWGDHICGIWADRDQQMEVTGPYVSAGIRAGQRCLWVAPEESAAALRKWLSDAGGDLPSLEASGQLLLISAVDFYLKDGMFEPDRTLELVHTVLEDSRRDGYSTMRVANDVSWIGDGEVDPARWEDYEARLTHAISPLPLVMVCQYDGRQVSGELLVTALKTHPTVILGDRFHQNPFYATAATSGTDLPELM